MGKYKCPQPGCKYTSDKPGECCNIKLVKVESKEKQKSESKKSGGCPCCT